MVQQAGREQWLLANSPLPRITTVDHVHYTIRTLFAVLLVAPMVMILPVTAIEVDCLETGGASSTKYALLPDLYLAVNAPRATCLEF